MKTPRQIALMGMLIALNLAIGGLVYVLKLPIYLDAIGTILGTVLLGLGAGVFIGISSFALDAMLLNPVYIWFVGTQAAIAIYIYITTSRLKVFRSWPRVLIAGIGLGIVTGVVSAPIIAGLFGGATGSGRDVITALIAGTGTQIYKAVVMSGVASEPIDKTLQLFISYLVLKSLPRRLMAQFRNTLLDNNYVF